LSSATEIRRLGPDEWEIFRDVRLAALREAPYAFGSTLAREEALTEEHWRKRLADEDRVRLVAQLDDRVVATVGVGPSTYSRAADLTSMWVDPDVRHRGIGRALVEEAIQRSRDAGYKEIFLWVVDGNSNAERLYERLGFRRTGDVHKVREGEEPVEYEMVCRL
jgi:ribosomal protein S18 acetylase RimI-like enzyme